MSVWTNPTIPRHLGRSDEAIRLHWQEWIHNDRYQRQNGSGGDTAGTDIVIVGASATAPESSLSTIHRVARTHESNMTLGR